MQGTNGVVAGQIVYSGLYNGYDFNGCVQTERYIWGKKRLVVGP